MRNWTENALYHIYVWCIVKNFPIFLCWQLWCGGELDGGFDRNIEFIPYLSLSFPHTAVVTEWNRIEWYLWVHEKRVCVCVYWWTVYTVR